MLPIVVLLLDGLGDRAHEELGGRTACEAAVTPNLDALAARGSCGVLWPLGPGRAPSSEVAHWAMLGYRPDEFPGRATFEALGHGLEMSQDVFAYAALRPAERRPDGLWLTGRAGAADEAHARALVAACDGVQLDGLRFSLHYLRRGEAILRIAGGADDRVTDTDAFFRDRHPVLRPRALVPEAERTARATETWTRRTVATLAAHPANADRRPPLAVVTLKWWGRPRHAPTFRARHGLHGTIVGASPFLRGLATTLGLDAVTSPETEQTSQDVCARLALVEQLLDAGDSFVWCHVKAIDEAGHTKDPRAKARAIEAVDAALAALPAGRAVVCVTGDHATPASREVIHSGDPVPLVVAGPGVRADGVAAFGELPCAAGILGHLRGTDLMPVLLNAADRPLFLGSRPTAVDGADGYPAVLDPFRR